MTTDQEFLKSMKIEPVVIQDPPMQRAAELSEIYRLRASLQRESREAAFMRERFWWTFGTLQGVLLLIIIGSIVSAPKG